jgi:hypothetical protein
LEQLDVAHVRARDFHACRDDFIEQLGEILGLDEPRADCCMRVMAERSALSCALRTRMASSERLRSGMSRAIFEAPMMFPDASFSGEIVRDTGTRYPSFVRRSVS